jgi:phosphatidylglycerol:prolipoprotein diacylglycerol transferase
LLWLLARRPQPLGRVSAAFLIGYGAFRFVAEYFRQPDDFLGILSFGLSMGQWLCLPMMLAGALLWTWSARAAVGTQGAR